MSCFISMASALLLLWLVAEPAAGEYSSQALSTFVDTLLAEYDREAAPQARTNVALAMDVRHATVNDAASTMSLLADIKISWVDSRLSWNSSGWSEDSVLVPAERLWTPDIELVNAGASRAPGAAVLRARLTSEGSVAAVHRLALSVPLALQLQDWPRDVQRAVFKFASRAHTQDEIDLSVSDYAHSLVVESGSWEILSVVGVQSTWTRGDDEVPVVSWTVRAARRGAARAATGGAVLAAAAITLLAAAALPYSQRAPLAAAAAFIAAMWLVTAMFHLPAAASCPRLVRIQCAMCVLAALAALGAAGAAALAHRSAPPPPLLRTLLSSLSAHVQALAHDPESSSGKSGAWAAAAQLLDAVLVAVLVITVIVLCIVQIAQ